MRVCNAPGCNRGGRLRRGYCVRHYTQLLRHGRLTPERENSSQVGNCGAPGCAKPKYAKGHCRQHYYQLLHFGRLTPEKERSGPRPMCAAPGCDLRAVLKGHCIKHARQIERHGRLTPERENFRETPCSAVNCDRPARTRGMCHMHYQREWAKTAA